MNRTKKYIYKNAFTLIEVLVAVAILSLLVVPIAKISKDLFFNQNKIKSSLAAESSSRTTLKNLSRELRSSVPAANGSYYIESVSSSTIIFYSDLDNDGTSERVRYFLSGNVLKKGITKAAGQPSVYNLTAEKVYDQVHNLSTTTPVFTYFSNSTSSELSGGAFINLIRLVRIQLYPQVNNSNLFFETSVSIRNLKDNL